MKNSNWLAGVLIASTITLAGCTSYDQVQLRQQQLSSDYTYYKLSPPLYTGDIVQYKLKDGSHETVTVQNTTPQGIITSTDQVIPYKDMISLERKDFSKGKTAAAVGAGVGATAVVLITVFAVTLGAGFAAILAGS
ncbi:hypothetical protein OP063_004683 [Salmonella enterica subsp. enterica]|uniref:Phage-related lipoprotein n=2 Tax=Salmonella enterica TaxID=28901 RepID=A0A5U0Q146_SALER|nr:hypothetical protein [Salmonella enterica subsp. enterica serovar Montevideo]EAM5970652.1 hypothetical protein [Salmonella enterica]EBV7220569.1 hypothetical protein [Salmonella enterica subsp. enterica serovar Oranienburg]ECI5994585.1 hypothetical protein [Salmonella enterica subsp. enterica]ECM4657350.1 hypothetical protein [Salmonella enterica subsp. enterica serovar Muenchen]EDB5723580.1 hypothetical protein [Salmonella enterica subsp. enterica serovar Rubislaw]EDT7597411.1 hypothetica